MPSVRRSPVPDGPFGADAGSAGSPPGPPRSAGRSPGHAAVRPSRVRKARATRTRLVLPSVGTAERGRWRVIALALTLTAVVAFALTRGGELDPGGRDQARADAETPADPAVPSLPTDPSPGPPPQCSGDATTPAAPEPAQAVPAATADYSSRARSKAAWEPTPIPNSSRSRGGSSVFTADGRTGVTVLRFAGGRGLALAPTTHVIRSSGYSIELLFRSISSPGTGRSSTSRTAPPTMACTCWTDA